MSGNVGLGAIMTKDKKIISGLLSKGANFAASKGYGKRRKTRKRRSRK